MRIKTKAIALATIAFSAMGAYAQNEANASLTQNDLAVVQVNNKPELSTRVLSLPGTNPGKNVSSSYLPAADSIVPTKRWHYLVEPYAMFPNMSGTMGVGTLPDVKVSEDPSDIFSNLQIGAMLYGEAYNDRWAITSDMLYMKLGQDISSTGAIQSGNVTAKQLGWEVAVLRKFLPWLEAGVGAQLNSFKTNIDLVTVIPGGTMPKSAEITKTWVDPTIIARAKFSLGRRWLIQGRGNIGGFGVGSSLAWQLQGYATFRASRLLSLSAGYRVIDVDYDKGSGNDRFLYNVTTFGPVIRFGFNF